MANIVDSCCVNIQMTKSDRNNNNTTATNINDEVLPSSEQCDVLLNGADDKSENTADSDDHQLLSNDTNSKTNTNVASSPTDELEEPTNIETSSNVTNSYKDFSGIDTKSFITTTLRNNRKDRTLLLTLEKVFQDFIQNEEQTSYQFQAMNSYERMIVHRVAAFFGLDHNVDKNGQSIIVTKTANTRVPNFSFQSFIPTDELANGAITTLNPSVENTTRRISRRNDKNPNQSISTTTKPSFERTNYYSETRNKLSNQPFNKPNRKQQHFSTNQHIQQTNFHPSSHIINTRAQLIYSPTPSLYYPQQRPINPELKPQIPTSSLYNFVPMMSPTSFQPGNGIQLPILLQQQPGGQLQYVFPTQQPHQLSADGQYMPVYRSDMMQPVLDNNSSQQPYVHLYPTHPYPHAQPTTYIQSAPSFMIPPNHQTPIQYATNQLATLNIQSHYGNTRFPQSNNSMKSFVQTSTNGLTRMPNYYPYRQTRPLNTNNNTDKQLTPIENDIKSTINNNNNSDQISHSELVQEKD
ncbi:unnamed protein product [Adineta steineri]|uniref:R3H domain-containing protein n=2 Tax=Adineta steineri TaxID=433720 RepID=A0A818K110_9BILA|nr:unnamed protein product [Adineta steineri]CAF1446665.1 unnamed protein product [Adineta steineri]CAF3548557.1 unnamed protein product [Adineta steineri]CAF3800414.1 unnamed protein product [Adineta steineri]